MATKKVIVVPDPHAHPNYNNDRAEWLGKMIADARPDVVICLGDSADLPSLSSYDKNTRAFQGRSYRKDIDAHLDFQEKMWNEVKKRKKKLPKRIFLEGNHEHRIEKALDTSPELEGTISFKDLELNHFYDEVIRYNGGTPGVYVDSGIHYAHYFTSGVMGRPISGEHQAYTLLTKKFVPCTQGHTHTFDYSLRQDINGKVLQGLVCGVFQDYDSEWAGETNKLWYRGVVIKDNVEDGSYDLTHVSIDSLKKEYKR